MKEITFSIESRAENVALVTASVVALCQLIELAATDIHRVELGLAEALNNAVEHAYGEEAAGAIQVRWRYQPGELQLEIQEQGQTMEQLPNLSLPHPLDEGGRGWPIITACFDQVHYHSDASDATCINVTTLVKQFPDTAN